MTDLLTAALDPQELILSFFSWYITLPSHFYFCIYVKFM